MKRILIAALIGAAPLLPIGTAQAQPASTDEQQIHDVLVRQADATSRWDLATAAEYTCASNPLPPAGPAAMVPPMAIFSPGTVAATGRDRFATNLAYQFDVPAESTLPVVDAILRGDEPAYLEAMGGVMQQSTTVRLAGVDNIVVDGDTATADVTTTVAIGVRPPQTQVSTTKLLREDGQWCTSV